ncbi:hypothetical protein [Sphingobacterium haloxyli]|uniref:hypothetical protein n=1 Tax=Sphingobacterium haloxyli TaxID=2100533 RepID=UPI0010572927|nr:hypothetical protein [Sphingobacterium haloxyli]
MILVYLLLKGFKLLIGSFGNCTGNHYASVFFWIFTKFGIDYYKSAFYLFNSVYYRLSFEFNKVKFPIFVNRKEKVTFPDIFVFDKTIIHTDFADTFFAYIVQCELLSVFMGGGFIAVATSIPS